MTKEMLKGIKKMDWKLTGKGGKLGQKAFEEKQLRKEERRKGKKVVYSVERPHMAASQRIC
jgi:hypothetical protein